MAGAGITLTAESVGWEELRSAIARARDLTMRPRQMMAEMGQKGVQQTKRRFQTGTAPDGSPWAPKLPLFVQLEGGHSKPLMDSGKLMTTITHQEPDDSTTQYGSALPYAARMHWGGKGSRPAPFFVQVTKGQDWREGKLVLKQTEGARMVFMNIDVRPRPFLGLSADDRAAMLAVVEAYLSKWFLAPLRGKGGN
jgi:phage gpG-like protein